jgi:dGTPase
MEPGGVGRRFLAHQQPSLEAQLCNLADEIAYNAHDIDDGVRSGLITLAQLPMCRCLTTIASGAGRSSASAGRTQERRLLFEAIRRMLSAQVYDVIEATQAALDQAQPGDVSAVRLPPLVQFDAEMQGQSKSLKAFLLQKLYRHPQVMQTTGLAKLVVRDLFNAYLAAPHEMPASHQRRWQQVAGVCKWVTSLAGQGGGRLHCRHDRPVCRP